MQTSLKTGFAQISVAAQKIRAAQNLRAGGTAAPLAPLPARTPMRVMVTKTSLFLAFTLWGQCKEMCEQENNSEGWESG